MFYDNLFSPGTKTINIDKLQDIWFYDNLFSPGTKTVVSFYVLSK